MCLNGIGAGRSTGSVDERDGWTVRVWNSRVSFFCGNKVLFIHKREVSDQKKRIFLQTEQSQAMKQC